jgi:hypothetical protein
MSRVGMDVGGTRLERSREIARNVPSAPEDVR